ncbi:MAG: MarR family transcriptional regulator [Actinomycetota bacterium]
MADTQPPTPQRATPSDAPPSDAPPSDAPPSGALTSSLAMILIAVGSRLREQLDEQLGEFDITMRHLGPLGHLAASPELSTSDLARRAGVTPQSMRATVDHLESIGAVEHRRHGQGKASELLVTEAGRELLQQARDIVAELDTELLGDIDYTDELRSALVSAMIELINRQRSDGLL